MFIKVQVSIICQQYLQGYIYSPIMEGKDRKDTIMISQITFDKLISVYICLLMVLQQLLYTFKNKNIGHLEIRSLLSLMKQNNLQTVNLWNISSLARVTTSTAKLQAFFVIVAGLLFIPAAIYDKYTQDPSKIYKIAVYTPIAFGFVMTPFYLYRRTSKRLLNSIDYNIATNKFQLQTYKHEMLDVALNQIQVKYNPDKVKVVKQIEINQEGKQRIFNIEGYGQWQSSELFRYITEKGELKEQL